MVLSSEPVARVSLSGLQARHDTPAMWPTKVSMWAPVSASQIMAVASAEAEAIHRPSGEMRTWEIGFSWPRSSSEGSKFGRRGFCDGRSGVVEVERRGVRREEVRERERERDLDLDLDLERESRRDLDRDRDLDLDLDLDCDLESEREPALDLERDRDLEGGLYGRLSSLWISLLCGSVLCDLDWGLAWRIERLRRWLRCEVDAGLSSSCSRSGSGSVPGELCSALPSFRLRRLEGWAEVLSSSSGSDIMVRSLNSSEELRPGVTDVSGLVELLKQHVLRHDGNPTSSDKQFRKFAAGGCPRRQAKEGQAVPGVQGWRQEGCSCRSWD